MIFLPWRKDVHLIVKAAFETFFFKGHLFETTDIYYAVSFFESICKKIDKVHNANICQHNREIVNSIRLQKLTWSKQMQGKKTLTPKHSNSMLRIYADFFGATSVLK